MESAEVTIAVGMDQWLSGRERSGKCLEQSAEASGYAYGRGFEEKDCAHTDVQDRSGTEL